MAGDEQFVQLPGGTFTMGSEAGENDEKPLHEVTISSFAMHRHEVTEEEYAACVASGRCTPAHYSDSVCRAWNGTMFARVIVPENRRSGNFPVVCVTWHQARAYCQTINGSLPTEAQWEYAAKSASSGKSCTSRNTSGPYQVGSCGGIVGTLSDMNGNAWEWVNDYYDPMAYAISASVNPAGSEAGLYRGIRGGGWYSTDVQKRSTNRHWFSPDYGEVSIGFRCVKR